MRVFITGASSGIGRALAHGYAARKARLGLLARRGDELSRLAAELRERGAAAAVYAADVSDARGVRSAIEDFVAQHGGVDRVIANAGIGIRDALCEGDAESMAKLFAVNVIGVSNTIVPCVPHMLRQRAGILVAVGSVAGFRALPGSAAYSASKAAVVTFMDAVRMQLAGSGVHAMTLCPGFVRTPMTAPLQHELPFLLELDAAARLMLNAIESKKKTYTLPWQMNLLRHVMRSAPEWALRRIVASAEARRATPGLTRESNDST